MKCHREIKVRKFEKIPRDCKLPKEVTYPPEPHGYLVQNPSIYPHPFYTTTSNDYGRAHKKMNCSQDQAETGLKTSDFYRTMNIPNRFENPSWFYGYGVHRKPQNHVFYRTTSSEYGRLPPSIHNVPTKYFPRTQDFSKSFNACGPYRNYSLNTGTDVHLL